MKRKISQLPQDLTSRAGTRDGPVLRTVWRSISVKSKITLAATLLFLLSLFLVSLVQLYYVNAQMKHVLSDQQHTFVSRVADELDQKLLTNRDAIAAAASAFPSELALAAGDLEKWLEQRAALRSLFSDLFVLSNKGIVLADMPPRGRRGIDISEQENFHTTVTTRQPYISRPFIGKWAKQPVVTMSAPIFDKQGNLIAVVDGSLDLLQSNFLGNLSDARVGKTGSFAVFTRDRLIVASRDRDRVMTKGPPPGVSPYFDRATSGLEGSEEAVNSRGLRAIYSYSQLEAAPWVLVASLPIDEAYAPIQATQHRIVQATLVLGLLVAPLIWLAVRRFYDPLRKALGEREAGLHRAQALAKLSHVITGPDGGFESWPETLPRLIGRNPAEMPRSTREWLQILHPQDRERFRSASIAAATKKARGDIEYRLQREGQWVHVRQVMEPLEEQVAATAGIRWFNTLQDVTDQKQAEAALQASEQRYRVIFDQVAVGVAHSDVGGRFLNVNPRFSEITGYSHEEALRIGIREVTHPDDLERSREARAALLAGTEPPYEREARLIRKDGSEIWAHITTTLIQTEPGRPGQFVSVVHDISERKLAAEALAASEERLTLFVEHAPAAIAMLDNDMRYVAVSRRWLADYRLGEQDVRGRSHYEVFPDIPEQWKEIHRRCLSGAVEKCEEDPFSRADGRLDWVRWEIHPWRRQSGAIGGIMLFSELITERKDAADRIRRLNRVYALLSGINTLIVRVRDRDELFREACRIAVEQGGFGMAWIGEFDRATLEVTPVAWNGMDEGAASIKASARSDIPEGQGMVGRAIRDKKIVITNDINADPGAGGPRRLEALRKGFQSIIAMPLMVDSEVRATLTLFARERDFFSDEELKLLTELAGDISFALDHIEKAEKLDYLAYYDALTGLANRSLLVERLEGRLLAARIGEYRVAVTVLNIDRLKEINDAFGRRAGDRVVQEVAERLKRLRGDPTRLARIVPDYFAVISANVEKEDEVARETERELHACFDRPFEFEGQELAITAKAGIALFPEDGLDAESLLRCAKAALQKARDAGERYLFFRQDMMKRIAEKLALENKLRQAIAKEEFVLFYQPKVDLPGRRIVGLEALIRWQSPEMGLVAPLRFIPLLEETGLIRQVGAWALAQAARDHRSWVEQGLPAPRVAVNVSPIQLRQRDFVSTLEQALSAGIAPTAIDLEITESLIMEDIKGNIEKLEAVRQLGVNVAIDDFGTGYSSLAYLARLPVEMLKIDRAFVDSMFKDQANATLVQTIISMAHSLGLKVVAEGVETEDQAKVLELLRCDQMQGYLFSKPLPAKGIVDLLRARSGEHTAFL